MRKNKLENYRKKEFFLNKLFHFFFSKKFEKKIFYEFDKRNRIEFIKSIIAKKNYQNYLEIGCHNNEVFDKIEVDKVGVDPISGGTVRATSDQFFLQNKKLFDCIFIDGLHIYEQVIRDIKNSLNFLNDDGVIILHDCLPKSISHQRVPRTRYNWNGDVWKAMVEVRTWDNCDAFTVLADQGLGVIKKKDNSNKIFIDNKNFKKLKFRFFYNNYRKIMKTVTFEKGIELV